MTVFDGPADGFSDNPLLLEESLVLGDADELDTRSDYWASDVGVDGGAASAEEAAVHIVADDRER